MIIQGVLQWHEWKVGPYGSSSSFSRHVLKRNFGTLLSICLSACLSSHFPAFLPSPSLSLPLLTTHIFSFPSPHSYPSFPSPFHTWCECYLFVLVYPSHDDYLSSSSEIQSMDRDTYL